MPSAGDVARRFYEAVKKRDLVAARAFLSDDLVFVGLFETYHGPSEYLKALEGLLGITTGLDVKAVIAEGDQAAVFFELDTVAPAAATPSWPSGCGSRTGGSSGSSRRSTDAPSPRCSAADTAFP